MGLAVKRGAPIQTAVPSDGLLAVTGGIFQKFRKDGDLPEKITDRSVSEKRWNFHGAQQYAGPVEGPDYKGFAGGGGDLSVLVFVGGARQVVQVAA